MCGRSATKERADVSAGVGARARAPLRRPGLLVLGTPGLTGAAPIKTGRERLAQVDEVLLGDGRGRVVARLEGTRVLGGQRGERCDEE